MSFCKNCDESNSGESESHEIAGSWKMVSITTWTTQYGAIDNLIFLNSLSGDSCLSNVILTLEPDGNIRASVPNGCLLNQETGIIDTNGTWEIAGKKICMRRSDGNFEKYDFAIEGREMKWSFYENENGENYKYTIAFVRK